MHSSPPSAQLQQSRPALHQPRISSVDVARGLVMIIMTLDHVRDYFGNVLADPTDPKTTTVALFLTRWITHFCAPTFFLLTGVSAYLSSQRRGSGSMASFLVRRGLWLIVLEVIVMRCLAYQFNFDFKVTLLFILWALGWSMIVLAGLSRWKPTVALVFGVVMILTHNLFDGIPAQALGWAAPLWTVLHAPGLLVAGPDRFVLAAYSLVPWVGVTALGYGMAPLFTGDAQRRRSILVRAGAAMIVAFVVLRTINLYGDPSRWSVQHSPIFTALSFLNTTKYPPSLLFLLMTLGPLFLFLRAIDGGVPRAFDRVATLGRVPLFYFVLHIALIHVLAVIACYARYGDVHWMFESPTLADFPFTQPPGWPLSLPYLYLIWWVVVLMLWPLCRWFAGVKRRRRDWWLGYL